MSISYSNWPTSTNVSETLAAAGITLKDLRREYRAEQERLGQLLNCPINAGGVDVDCGVGNVTVC
jgi:hypothetical protein